MTDAHAGPDHGGTTSAGPAADPLAFAGGSTDPYALPEAEGQLDCPGPTALPKRGLPTAIHDAVGKVWNTPNTAMGLAYGLTGHLVGELAGNDPRIVRGRNSIDFIGNPFGGKGAITLGDTTTYKGDPYDRRDGSSKTKDHNPVYEHEEAHTRQGEVLGPFYLPSNIAGGLWGLARNRDWHGPANWNETGPQMNPPRAWPRRR